MLPRPPTSSDNSKKRGASLLDRMNGALSSSPYFHRSTSPHTGNGDRSVQSSHNGGDNRSCDRSVQSNQDTPIDLTNFDTLTGDEDDTSEDYIPASLAAFVAQAHSTLEETQQDFLGEINASTSNDPTTNSALEERGSTEEPYNVEDEQDRALKGEILERYSHSSNHNNDLLSPDLWKSPPPNPVCGMTDSQIQRQAVGQQDFFSPNNGQPVDLLDASSLDDPTMAAVVAQGSSFVSPPAANNSPEDPFAGLMAMGDTNINAGGASAFSSPRPPPAMMRMPAAEASVAAAAPPDYFAAVAQQKVTDAVTADDSSKTQSSSGTNRAEPGRRVRVRVATTTTDQHGARLDQYGGRCPRGNDSSKNAKGRSRRSVLSRQRGPQKVRGSRGHCTVVEHGCQGPRQDAVAQSKTAAGNAGRIARVRLGSGSRGAAGAAKGNQCFDGKDG